MITQKISYLSVIICAMFSYSLAAMEEEVTSCYACEPYSLSKMDGVRGLFLACTSGDYKMVDFFLDQGVDPDYGDEYEMTPLFIASQLGHVKVVKSLLNGGAFVDALSRSGSTPLFVAAQWGHPEVVKVLLAAGADVYAKNRKGFTALGIAKINRYTEIIKLLQDHMQKNTWELKKAKRKTW